MSNQQLFQFHLNSKFQLYMFQPLNFQSLVFFALKLYSEQFPLSHPTVLLYLLLTNNA